MVDLSYEDIVNEIVEFSGMNRDEVKKKVWEEVFEPGCIVKKDAEKFGIDFFVYNDKMEEFYVNSYGFIFETLINSQRPLRKKLIKNISNRIKKYQKSMNNINILMMGDGVATDTIYLYNELSRKDNKANIYYFDVPGSRTYDYALNRIKNQQIKVEFINEFDDISKDFFDVIVCIEVLEHLPNPEITISYFKDFLKKNGIVLITESFALLTSFYPTHLKANTVYAGRTPFLFLKEGLLLNYYNKEFNSLFVPTEYLKKEKLSLIDKLRVYFDKWVIYKYIFHFVRWLIRGEIHLLPL